MIASPKSCSSPSICSIALCIAPTKQLKLLIIGSQGASHISLLLYTLTRPRADQFRRKFMKLLNTYDDRDEAEKSEQLIDGEKRLASERDGTETVYNLFGQPTWSNLYKLEMYNLPLLQRILKQRDNNQSFDEKKHQEIISMLRYAVNNFDLKIPAHWL